MKSKVLLIIPHLSIGGTEMQTLNLATALVDGGHEVHILCLFRNLPSVVNSFETIGAKVHIVSPEYNNSQIIIQYPKKLKLVRFVYTALKKILKNTEFQYIHVQYMTPGTTIILLLRFVWRFKNILATIHTYAGVNDNIKLVRFIQRYCIGVFTCITLAAEESYFGTSQLYTPTTNLKRHNHFTIYNSLPKNFETTQIQREFDMPITIGVVSRLEHIKGMDLVIPAYAEILKEFPDTKLIVVGDGALRQSMEQQAVALHCNSSITWAGRQPQEHIQEWYSRIDVLLMPSRSEGFGLTAIEAMASGCVVVASDVGGLPEVVRDGEVGLLHTSESVSGIVEKVKKLMAAPGLMERLSVNAVKYVGQYSIDRYTLLFNDLYSKLSR